MESIGKGIVVVFVLLSLTSCAGLFKKPPVVVTESRLIPITPPAVMYKSCKIPSPPDKESYMKGDLDYRLGSMLRYNARLISAIKRCDNTIQSLKKWQSKQASMFRTPTKSK